MKIIKSECLHQRKAHIFLTPEIILVAFRNTNQGHIKPWLRGGKGCCPSKVYPLREEEVKGKITLLRLMQCNCFPHDGALPFSSLRKFPWLQKDVAHTYFFFFFLQKDNKSQGYKMTSCGSSEFVILLLKVFYWPT